MARGFIDHPYWARMSRMLMNSEREELATLLDPTAGEQHALSRAAVAYIRKLLAMPLIDLRQGDNAAKAVASYKAKFGVARNSAERT